MSAEATEVTDGIRDTGYVRVCALDDLTVGAAAAADIFGRRISIVRTSDREVHAVDDTCSHANVSLAEGEVDGCTLECWLHGSRFSLVTGEPTGLPATQPIAVHDVRIEGDDVLVRLNTENES